ncbi:hypothetical protein ACQP1P_29815 [Dactylosporangium sp. CA-052675]|uniref:hypothetical protein n=1 Tax=Dactylosporangium sp. CA-052675 TaxID=3239927 RepID=UPI003D94F376
MLASTDVGDTTNEITRFTELLDRIDDPRDGVVTADALHCQRARVAHVARSRLTVEGNQPSPHRQLAGLTWRLVPVAHADTADDHGRREIRHQAKPTYLTDCVESHHMLDVGVLGRRAA